MTITNIPVPVTLFGKPNCQGCKLTQRKFDQLGLPYTYRDITEDAEALAIVQALGYQSVPVVTAGDMHWSGFSPDRITSLARAHTYAPDLACSAQAAIDYLKDNA